MEIYVLVDKVCLEGFANRLMDTIRIGYKGTLVSATQALLAMQKGNNTLQRLVLRTIATGIVQYG
jgi:hypothetical protein